MPRLLLLVFLVFTLDMVARSEPLRASPAEAEVNRLVRQLGSDRFSEREAAYKALAKLGERALAVLRAAQRSPDPEVRRRSAELLWPLENRAAAREIQAIKASKLSPREKGRRLKAFITHGMLKPEVDQLLGKSKVLCIDIYRDGRADMEVHYKTYDVYIRFQSGRGSEEFQVVLERPRP